MTNCVLCFSVVQLDSSRAPEPRHILSRHSLPITDLHCGLMGPQARVATASLDQTVKVSFARVVLMDVNKIKIKTYIAISEVYIYIKAIL